jgi:hypothetical protein
MVKIAKGEMLGPEAVIGLIVGQGHEGGKDQPHGGDQANP